MAITAITSVEQFDELVLELLLLLLFVLDESSDGRVKFFSVDAEDKALRPILLKEDVEGIPSMVFFKEGKLLDRLAGYKKAAVLESLINEVIKQF